MAWLEPGRASSRSRVRVLLPLLRQRVLCLAMMAAVSALLFGLTVLLTGDLLLSASAAAAELLLFGLLGGRQASMRERWRRFLLTLGTEFFLAPPVALLWLQRAWRTITYHRPFGEGALYAGLAAVVFAVVVAVGGVLLGATCVTTLVRLQPLPEVKRGAKRRGTRRNS